MSLSCSAPPSPYFINKQNKTKNLSILTSVNLELQLPSGNLLFSSGISSSGKHKLLKTLGERVYVSWTMKVHGSHRLQHSLSCPAGAPGHCLLPSLGTAGRLSIPQWRHMGSVTFASLTSCTGLALLSTSCGSRAVPASSCPGCSAGGKCVLCS